MSSKCPLTYNTQLNVSCIPIVCNSIILTLLGNVPQFTTSSSNIRLIWQIWAMIVSVSNDRLYSSGHISIYKI